MPHHAVPGAGRYAPDYLSTLPSRALQQIMRDTSTLPLPSLINGGGFTVDYDAHRVWRDCFWKGSFAKDTLLGWEERIMTPIHPSGPQYTGGRFWKRFDEIRDNEAYGRVVNYGLSFLPGLPVVREEVFPDDSRPYARASDTVLLLTYRNPPYRIVYDLIKVVDHDNCIGVMHLGTYPRGRVFGTFVMSRSNHPFQKMAVPDHDAIFTSSRARVPQPSELTGRWQGHLVLSTRPHLTLHHQFNAPLARMDVHQGDRGLEARMRVGLASSRRRVDFGADEAILEGSGAREHIRWIEDGTLLGRRTTRRSADPTLRYVLTRVQP